MQATYLFIIICMLYGCETCKACTCKLLYGLLVPTQLAYCSKHVARYSTVNGSLVYNLYVSLQLCAFYLMVGICGIVVVFIISMCMLMRYDFIILNYAYIRTCTSFTKSEEKVSYDN